MKLTSNTGKAFVAQLTCATLSAGIVTDALETLLLHLEHWHLHSFRPHLLFSVQHLKLIRFVQPILVFPGHSLYVSLSSQQFDSL